MLVLRHVSPLAVLVLVSVFSTSAWAERREAGFAPIDIEDPSGGALEGFFSALTRTASGENGAITRIAHYGDSLVVGDAITRELRRAFQHRFGDGGPGFVLAKRPWSWYRREGLRMGGTGGWKIYRSLTGGPADRFYGFGGSTFVTHRSHQRVWIETNEIDGRPVHASTIEVHYLAQPRGGDLDVLIDGAHLLTISTEREKAVSAFHTLRVPDGPHKIILRTARGGRPVRLFGVALEREGPGVVYDSLGINGASTTVMGRMDHEHLRQQLSHRHPDLVVLAFGANESNRPGLVDRYRSEVLPAVRSLRRASGGASCLLVAPMDRAMRNATGRAVSSPLIPRIIGAQRAIAREVGCAYFDTYSAMGGEGSMRAWASAGLAGGDLVHPTREGSELLGRGLFNALERAFIRHRQGL